MHKNIATRNFLLRTVIGFALLVLVARLYTIMIENGPQIKKSADIQNSLTVQVADRRSDILDRNMRAFTGVEKADYVVVFSTEDTKKDFKLCKILAKYSNENEYDIYSRLQVYKRTFTKVSGEYKTEIAKYQNFSVISVANRYLHDYPCASLIGYVGDSKGASGLEKVYDKPLSKVSDYSVSARADALMRFVPGGNIKTAGLNIKSSKLKTTLDLNYCRIAEDVLKKSDLKAGVVILDVNTFDLLAMATNPSFDPDNVKDYLDSKDGNLLNRCLTDYDMGSIFKIVVSAAALEQGAVSPEDKFVCKGYSYISGQKIDCHNIYGHGQITFEEAFMYSCNPVFIEIGQRIGYAKIIEYAEKFGIGKKILNPTSLHQGQGNLPDKNNYYLADLANLSIGQGLLSGNAVNGAVLTAVIANGGIIKQVNCVDSIVDSVGQKKKALRVFGEKRIISEKTALQIYKMMLKTNISGTGTSGYIEDFGSGGKTGSAQTGWVVDGQRYQHGWYTGFFPAQNPRFAMCVFVENGKSGSETAAPVFKEIGERIINTID
ncbi:MAG: penicillin-binding protein 2 [Clostridia bacterium]|nr:penicillin-binding protein 2 [Clostridia bacterium]